MVSQRRESTRQGMNQDHRPGRTQTQVDRDTDLTGQLRLDLGINGQWHTAGILWTHGQRQMPGCILLL
eukprot:6484633-Amphidinium_carterae.1